LAAAKAQWLKANPAGAKAPQSSACSSARLKSCTVTKSFLNHVFPQIDLSVTFKDSNAIALLVFPVP
jgi:hypothetical protein